MMTDHGIVDVSTGRVLADRASLARGVVRRLMGLLLRRRLEEGEGLIIPRCRAIHTWFMRFPIDLVFLQRSRVIRLIEVLPPWRITGAMRADAVIELPAGTISRSRVRVNDIMNIVEKPLDNAKRARV